MASSVAGATTVVDGPISGSHLKETYLREKEPLNASPPLKPKNIPFLAPQIDVDRPFFVNIGKDGLIAALQKLDLQLRNVGPPQSSRWHCSNPLVN